MRKSGRRPEDTPEALKRKAEVKRLNRYAKRLSKKHSLGAVKVLNKSREWREAL